MFFVIKGLLLPLKSFFLSVAWKLSIFRKTLREWLNSLNYSQSSLYLKEPTVKFNWRESSELK